MNGQDSNFARKNEPSAKEERIALSLANHPSARILQKFAKKSMANGSS
jgi:hypothetical protein